MTNRAELTAEAVALARAEKARLRERKAELAAMPAAERRAAKANDRARAREAGQLAKRERKEARRSMTRAERRLDSRRERIRRKVRNRPRRAIGWTVAVAAVTALALFAAPTVADISRLMSVRVTTDTPAGVAAREQSELLAERISDEGLVLLKNEEATLPLATKRLNVFSFAAHNLRFGGAGSGGADQSSAVGLHDALREQGISVNEELVATMEEAGAKAGDSSGSGLARIVKSAAARDKTEPAPDYLTDAVLAQARGFSDTALVVIGNDGAEALDFTPAQLRLTDTQRELLDTVTGSFDRVIVIVNSGNQMELGFIEDYPQITAAMWIGTPGPRGAVSLAKTLAGEVTPSGRLTDTYSYDVESAPGVKNFGDFQYANTKRGFLNYDESIYVGYRYFETCYAGDEDGYRAAVQFPFGFGLSYTDFAWSDAAFSENGANSGASNGADGRANGEQLSLSLTVTNTGDVRGKDVVQVYGSAPYTAGGIEKSSTVLLGYAKTGLLEPGASETVTVEFAKRDLASWDTAGGGGYILEGGDYTIRASENAHAAGQSFTMRVADPVRYAVDAATDEPLENRFGYAEEGITPLSRTDWEGTFPERPSGKHTASPELLDRMHPTFAAAAGDVPTTEAENGIVLADLKGLAYDDPRWEDFLDQFTVREQIEIFSRGGWRTEPVERLGMPGAVLLDGPAGLNFFFGNITAAAFPTEVVIASTFNDELAYEMGERVGAEANAYGVQGWYAPGMNIHRTPLGGRNFEYFSEDPLLSGKMSAAMVAGAQSKGVLTFMKHFALNEQEINARVPGVNVFATEQALREVYLRPFEITVKEGGANGAMTSFINIGGRWAGGNEELLQGVLRDEWGFTGVVSTDAVLGGFMDPALAVRYGNDLMLAPLANLTVSATERAYKQDPVGVGEGLRDRVHAVAYALLQTDLFA